MLLGDDSDWGVGFWSYKRVKRIGARRPATVSQMEQKDGCLFAIESRPLRVLRI